MSDKESKNIFDKFNEGIRGTEGSLVNFVSIFTPWLTPLIPAFMTFNHALVMFESRAIALISGATVEFLGFSTVSTFLSFQFYNRRLERSIKARAKKKGKIQAVNAKRSLRYAPTGVVVFAFSFYLFLIVCTNVLLDALPDAHWVQIAVRAGFTLQTIPAALIVAVRTQHRELLESLKRKEPETSGKVSEDKEESSGKFPNDWRKVLPYLTPEEVLSISQMSTAKIMKNYHLAEEKTARNWRKYAQAEVEKRGIKARVG